MAEVIATVGPGKDYESLSLWEANEQRTLGTDEIAVAECHAFVDTTAVTFSGWGGLVYDSAYCLIRAAAGAKHNGVVGAGYVLQPATWLNAASIQVVDVGLVLEDIEIRTPSSGNGNVILNSTANTGLRVRRCMLGQYSATAFGVFYGSGVQTSFEARFDSSLIYRGANCQGFYAASGWSGELYNVTVAKTGNTGVLSTTGAFLTLTNVVSHTNNATDFSGSFAGSSNCASRDLTAPGTNPVTGVTTTDFEDYTNNDYTPSDGGAIEAAGNNAVLPLTAIQNIAFLDPPSIGAYEVVGAPPSGQVDKVSGTALASIAERSGVPLASIAKINGVPT